MALKHHISFATYLPANFGCDQFRIMSETGIVSNLLRALPRSHLKSLCCSIRIWADALSSDRSSIQTGFTLHRIRLGTCCFQFFVPMSYFDSWTNEWSKDSAKRWALLWSATTSRQFIENFISNKTKSGPLVGCVCVCVGSGPIFAKH